jgi:hypothetical protein
MFEDWAEGELSAIRSGLNLKRPTDNGSMFKYIGLNTKTSWGYFERMLNELELVGSTAVNLNDPFEIAPNTLDDLRPYNVQEIAYNFMEKRNRRKNGISKLSAAEMSKFKADACEYIDRLKKYSRIISFCERVDSPLLWSHYANSYKGACIHFLGRAFRLSEGFPIYVNYSQHRPIYPLSLALKLYMSKTSNDTREKLNQLESNKICFFTKANDWAYENEIRIKYNSNLKKSIKFQKDGLMRIILGPKMSPENKNRIKELIANSKVPNLQISEARLSDNSFSVEINQHLKQK